MPSSVRGRNNGDKAVPSDANYTAPLAQYQVVGGGATHHRTGTVVANSSFSLSPRLPTDTEGYVVDDFTPPPAPAVIYAVPVEDGGGGQLPAVEYIIGGGVGGESSTDGDGEIDHPHTQHPHTMHCVNPSSIVLHCGVSYLSIRCACDTYSTPPSHAAPHHYQFPLFYLPPV